jgi:hypothetical protein
MRLRVPALLAALLVLAATPGAVGARGGNAAQGDHDRIVAYWTPQRIANARPRDYVMSSAGTLVPVTKPSGGGNKGGGGGHGGGGGGGGGGSVPTVTGASWTAGGAIEARSGRILFSDAEGDWICSGSVVSDGSTGNGYSLVVSAGHCAYDGGGGWATNWMYMPDFDASPNYNCATRTLGCWTATSLVLWSAFVSGGGFGNSTLGYDWSIARVGLGGSGGNTELDSYGSYPLKTSGNGAGDSAWAFGYPAAGKYHGNDLTYCSGKTVRDPYGEPTWGLRCDMTGGSSGGPWLVGTTDPAGGSGSIASVNSYGYSGLKYMFGPIFNSNTASTYNAAKSLNPTSGVTIHPE